MLSRCENGMLREPSFEAPGQTPVPSLAPVFAYSPPQSCSPTPGHGCLFFLHVNFFPTDFHHPFPVTRRQTGTRDGVHTGHSNTQPELYIAPTWGGGRRGLAARHHISSEAAFVPSYSAFGSWALDTEVDIIRLVSNLAALCVSLLRCTIKSINAPCTF